MATLEIWDKETSLYLADGKLYTKEQIFEQFPFSETIPSVLTKNRYGHVMAFDNLGTLCEIYEIADDVSDEEALEAIKTKQAEAKAQATNATA